MAGLLTLLSGIAGDPIYEITNSATSLNEGSSVTFTINTINVPNGTTLYWTTSTVSGTINGSDFSDGADSGSFIINSNTGSVTRTLSEDQTTEGSESFQLQIRTGSTSGTVVATSSTVTIGDTSLTRTYSITPSTTSVNEGSSVTFTVNTTNVPNGTTLYWTTSTVSGTINGSDFSDGADSGSFIINSNTGSVTRTLVNDLSNEGAETFQLQIRTESTSGTVVVTSSTITINDTSKGTFNVTGGNSVVDSGSYRIHIFTSPGTLTVNNAGPGAIEYLVVAGGGGGGSGHAGGGGGGGGYRTGPLTISTTPYPVIVGAGGAENLPGSDSSFGPITSTNGGRGGGGNGGPGGSGGGASGWPGTYSGGLGNSPPVSPPQGQPGGGKPAGDWGTGGGGGGATSGGSSGSPGRVNGGPGGPGATNPWIPTSYGSPARVFSGGGGGGGWGPNGPENPSPTGGFGGSGGSGGAGRGGNSGENGIPGTINTGGGGGGSNGEQGSSSRSGGSGGSGIVAIRYLR